MRVLLVKTSSLGDVLHALPAVTDAARAIPGIQFDWVVEEAFAEVPTWHPAVDRVIPVAIRRWRRSPLKALLSGEWSAFKKSLKGQSYDLVLDAQGLIKSALVARLANGLKAGLDQHSARESLASHFYDRPLTVQKGEHAIVRLRKLFSQALDYPLPESEADSGISIQPLSSTVPTILFVHGTTWVTKHWPERYWIELAKLVSEAGFRVMLPWGNEREQQRAERISGYSKADILPKGRLTDLVRQFQQVDGMVCVDSGLAHLGAALQIPSVTLYGATNPGLTGTWGKNQEHLSAILECSPCLKRRCEYQGASEVQPACYQELTPKRVWEQLSQLLNSTT